MKWLIFFTLLITAFFAKAQQKIGFVYVDSLLKEMPETKQADSLFQTEQARWQKILADREVELQNIADSLSQAGGGCLARYDWVPLKKHYDKKMYEYTDVEQQAQDSLKKYRGTLYDSVRNKLKNTIAGIALEKGLVAVLDADNELVLYFDNRYNLTAEVKKKLGLN